MRLRWHRSVEPNRITVRELVDHGLSHRPGACGIYWPDSQVAVCREHVEDEASLRMIDAVRDPTDTATVLVGRALGRKMTWLCSVRAGHDVD